MFTEQKPKGSEVFSLLRLRVASDPFSFLKFRLHPSIPKSYFLLECIITNEEAIRKSYAANSFFYQPDASIAPRLVSVA